jgi:hypothetical protein
VRRLCLAALLAATLPVPAQAPKKDAPRLSVISPIALDAGKPTKLTVRGLKLDGATEVRVHDPKSSGRVLVGKAKKVGGAPKNELLPWWGDEEIEVELTVAPEFPGRAVPFSVITPGGESNRVLVFVNDDTPRVAEKEPNDGFARPQAVTLPCVVEGLIQGNQDVDVFRFDAKGGQRYRFEVHGGRYGTPLDPRLALHDAAGRLLQSVDDGPGDSPDPVLEFTAPADGAYFIVVSDAHDLGGPLHAYRLECKPAR